MSNLKPSMIGLDKGLNLQVAKIIAPQGSILDTLNYEQVDFQGQKRIDGFTRFDGGQIAAIDDYYSISIATLSGGWAVDDLIASDRGLFGVVAKKTTDTITHLYVAINNYNNLPTVGEQVYRIISGLSVNGATVTAISTGVTSGATPDEHYTNILELNTTLRTRVTSLPGPVAGLHWFRDRLIAIAGVTYLSLEGATPKIYPEDVLECEGESAKVLDAITLDNTRAVFLDTMIPDVWLVEGNVVTRDSLQVGLVANGYESIPLTDEIATIFEARSEQQVLDEDGPSGPYRFGWLLRHTGWKVYFDNGISLYGSLPAINQNIEGVGTLGPTSTTDNNGAPAAINQGMSISGAPSQVNGWKSISSNTSYSPSPTDIQESDNEAVYADAYISWDGNSGAIIGDSGTLIEYSPTNTVRIGG